MTSPAQDTDRTTTPASPSTEAAAAPAPAPAPSAPTPAPDPTSTASDLGIDVGGMINDPNRSVDLSIDVVDGGIDIDTGLETGAGVEVSVSAPGGVPQVSVGGGGRVAAGGQFDTHGSYDDIDVATDADAGTMDADIESVDASASGYGGIEAGAEFGIDFSASPVDGGIPGIGVGGEVGFDTRSGLDLDAGYGNFDLHSDTGM
ncbi:hypothetical protein [Rhodococcus phenolicus]|uniref:hypothetical protein n=1 Tax=Rhodococcus phenolicus TaxID=263849 RepID=UPI0008307914|nr:hypothetical protein [Rhodococcus phenolicus]